MLWPWTAPFALAGRFWSFGPPPSRRRPVVVNSATASLLRFGDDLLAVTCSHVIEGYRRELTDVHRCLFAIANCYFDDPLGQLVAEDSAIDAAVLSLTMNQADQITRNSAGIGEAFYEVDMKSAAQAKVGDFVAYGGFPGCSRQVISFDELSFGNYSSGACRATDVHSDYMICEFEREFWIKSFPEPEPQSLRGLSGGPAFIMRHRPSGIISYEYGGLIYAMPESPESLFIRQAGALPIGWTRA